MKEIKVDKVYLPLCHERNSWGLMNKSHFVIFAFLVHLCFVFGAKSVLANPKEEAREHFERGVAFTQNDNYQYAAKEFEASLELYPTKSCLFNLAFCYWNLNEYEKVLKTTSRLRKEFSDEIDDEMKQDVSALEQKVRARTIEVVFQVNVNGAVLEVDGEEIGQSPLEDSIVLRRGRHTIVASREGYITEKRMVVLDNDHENKLMFVLERESSQTGTSEEPVEDAESGSVPMQPDKTERKRLGLAPFLIAGGVTLAAGVTTLVLNSQIGDKKESEDIQGARDLQTPGKIVFGVTMAGLATTVVLAFFTDFKRTSEQPEVVSVNVITPIFTEQGGGVALRGSF